MLEMAHTAPEKLEISAIDTLALLFASVGSLVTLRPLRPDHGVQGVHALLGLAQPLIVIVPRIGALISQQAQHV